MRTRRVKSRASQVGAEGAASFACLDHFVNIEVVSAKEPVEHTAETTASDVIRGSFEGAGLGHVVYGELEAGGRVGVL